MERYKSTGEPRERTGRRPDHGDRYITGDEQTGRRPDHGDRYITGDERTGRRPDHGDRYITGDERTGRRPGHGDRYITGDERTGRRPDHGDRYITGDERTGRRPDHGDRYITGDERAGRRPDHGDRYITGDERTGRHPDHGDRYITGDERTGRRPDHGDRYITGDERHPRELVVEDQARTIIHAFKVGTDFQYSCPASGLHSSESSDVPERQIGPHGTRGISFIKPGNIEQIGHDTLGAASIRSESLLRLYSTSTNQENDVHSIDGVQGINMEAELVAEETHARPSKNVVDLDNTNEEKSTVQTSDKSPAKHGKLTAKENSEQIEEEISKFLESEDKRASTESNKLSTARQKTGVSEGTLETTHTAVPTEQETTEKVQTVPTKDKDNTESKSPKKKSLWQSSVMMSIPKLMMMFDTQTAEERQNENVEETRRKSKRMANNYLILAVRNDSPHLVERLLDKSSALNIYTALLFSINLGRDHISKIFIEHPKYESVRQVTKMTKLGNFNVHTVGFEESDEHLTQDADDTVLTADVTPLMLAAQRNQFEVIKSLMSMGERIEEPHSRNCKCSECVIRNDELRDAKTRLNTYKALASDAYIVLAHTDPIFVAFELGRKLRKLAQEEKHYKADYLRLAEQCGDLSGRLLDRVWGGDELDTVLNEKSGSGLSSYENLARLKLAIHHREKKFVAHPACQKKLASLWIGTLNPSWVDGPWRVLFFIVCLTVLYPFMAIAYWIYPKKKVADFLRIPLVKFAAATCSYIIFIALLIGYSATEQRSSAVKLSTHEDTKHLYPNYTEHAKIPDIYIRVYTIGTGTIALFVWLLGIIWENVKKMYHEKFMYFTENKYNILDFVTLFLYIISFCFRLTAFELTRSSLSYFSSEQAWRSLSDNDTAAIDEFYWLNADRRTWKTWDPAIIAEAIFGIASLLSICKLTYVFTISERIGPLLISLAKMLEDVFAFMVIFVFIIVAFVVGFHNLFWYFYNDAGPTDTDVNSFSTLAKIVEQCFWSIFGLVEMENNMFSTSNVVTTITAHVMFAFYNWMMVIILINMLIAMMSRSYEFIAALEDIEWKYARTKLFLEYIRDDSTLTPPFNLVPTWKGVYLLGKKFSDDWCQRCAGRDPKPKQPGHHGNTKTNTIDKSHPGIYYSPNLNGKPGTSMNMSAQRSIGLRKMAEALDVKRGKSNSKEPSESYKRVIADVVKRFIQQYGKGKPGEESEAAGGAAAMDQLQRDMSSLRQELMSNIFRQNDERADISSRVNAIDRAVNRSREAFTKQHQHLKVENEARTDETKSKIDALESDLKGVHETLNENILDLRKQMEKQMKEYMISVEILKDGIFRLCADVTELRGRGSLSRELLVKQEGADDGRTTLKRPVGARLSVENTLSSDDRSAFREYGPIAVTAEKVVMEK